jgi:AraC-like DNA-binding protein
MSDEQSIQSFSTHAVPQGMRFEYWMSILRQSLWPVTGWTDLPEDFGFELREASLGSIASMSEKVSRHRSYRSRKDVEHSRDRCYLLFANQLPWDVAHNGYRDRCDRGDVVIVDSEGELETSAESGFDGIILKLPVDWLRTWLPEPDSIAGQRIARDSRWGRVLSPMVRQLTPELAASPPLPAGVLVDQLGVTLALITGESEAGAMPDLLKKIQDCIRQRFSEPQLTAADIAVSLNVPARILHRALAAGNTTFASQLLDARTDAALQMLASPSFKRLTITEIGRQAGFLSSSYFSRVVRKRTGRTPLELRRPAH